MVTRRADPQECFRFRGRYSEADVKVLARFAVAQLLDRRVGGSLVAGTVLLLVGAVLLRSWVAGVGGFLLILGLSALMRYVLLPGRLVRHARQLPDLSADRVITVDGGGIHCELSGTTQTFPSTTVRRLVLGKAHLFILLKPRGCLMLPFAWLEAPATIDHAVAFLVGRGDA